METIHNKTCLNSIDGTLASISDLVSFFMQICILKKPKCTIMKTRKRRILCYCRLQNVEAFQRLLDVLTALNGNGKLFAKV